MADNSAEDTTLDDTLNQTMQEIESRESDNSEETDEATEEGEETEGAADADADGGESADSQSDETGETDTDSESDDESEDADDVSSDDSVKQDDKTVKRPPGSWSAKGKAEFAKLPDHIQDEVLKREDDFHKGIQQYREKAEYADRISQVVQPYEPIIRAKNSTPERVVASMLNTAYQLESGNPQQKAQLLIQAAQQYGADMDALRQALNPENQQQRDPYIQQLEQEVYNLKNQFSNQQASVQQQSLAEATNSIEAFRNEVDESGQPKHLYFEDVKTDMADMIEAAERSGKQLSLQDAYDAAIWARPDIRETLLAQQQESKKREAQQKVQQAKKKASANVPTTGSHAQSSESPVGSIDDTLRATMKDIEARED